MAMDPELLGGAGASDPAPSADPAPSDNPGDQDETDGGGDKSPLEKMEIEPAEDGGAVITHHPKAPARVKNMDHESMRPKKHVVTSHKDLVKHIDTHAKRLTT
jgi:hypothetical protein